ncbi:type II toxin-antitoxin system PemK/MazF family toxin [Sulfurovum sp. bin170]|uniref:type II toxin-antitoxin system PemK/MazF family toxin n=1 Tax=Sulfurovum sp. bin170 TaxID=2695268 RepID=UPI0013DFC91C|nr:type II toxin-antitoxin system PemK/MazF family toxin [Sulfurovum sp. bin170]NEW59909.1 type II toxin-antitoxin system PemK/MazF family toxin [Sulfurovum sp. bin170]
MGNLLRGEIRWAELNPTVGREQQGLRPILILSDNAFNRYSGTVIAVAITNKKQKAGFPLTLKLDSKELPKESWVKISQIRTLSTKRIGKRIGEASNTEIVKVIEGLNEILGL